MKKRGGFTLVELLVVMTIIAILLGLGLVSYQGAHKSARDGRRKADLEEIRSALEMYRADESSYPTASGDVDSALSGPLTGYLEISNDSLPDQNYYYSGSGSTYELCTALEIGGSDTCTGSCGEDCNYQTTNP